MTIDQSMDLALSLFRNGRLAEAEKLYRQILAQNPNSADCLHVLGVVLAQSGKLEEAIELMRRSIAISPTSPQAHNNLANVLKDTNRIEEALAAYRQAIALKPDMANAHYNLAKTLAGRGQLPEALESFRRAIRFNPHFVQAHANMGSLLRDLGRLDEAIASFRQALALRPITAASPTPVRIEQADIYNSLACALRDQGQLDQAIAAYHKAIELHPDNALLYSNLGNALRDNRQLDAAIAACRHALALQPNNAAAHNNLGNALRDCGKFDEASASYRHAITLRPDYAEALSNLANTCKDQGQHEEAIDCFRRAVALQPNLASMHSNLVYALHYHPGYSPAAVYQELQEWNRRHALPHRASLQPHGNDLTPDRRLRIGYVSADFRGHVVGSNLYPLLSHHDHQQVEVFCYASVLRPDDMTDRLHKCADHWRNIVGVSDDDVAAQIRNDGIDILIDLSLHTAGNRLPVFARKPAPVQATYLGYCGSTGLSAIDYRLSDPYMDPPEASVSHYSEKTLRLPRTFWCYQPAGPTPEVSPLSALQTGHVTFGCLNNFAKVSPQSLDLWARILHAVPHSHLLLHCTGSSRDGVIKRMAHNRIPADRLEFVAKRPWAEYISTFAQIDIALDPFPYGGGISTCDALWMGVPVVTLMGQTAVGRAGVSILSNIGLTQCIATNQDAYVGIARDLAADLTVLAQLRAGLRQQMQTSPLLDAARFAADVEMAYRLMWQEVGNSGN